MKSVGEILKGIAGEKFTTKEHYYFYCRKIITNKGAFTLIKEDNLKYMCTLIFAISEQRKADIKKLQLKEPTSIFVQLLQTAKDYREMAANIDYMDEIMKEYFKILKDPNPNIDTYPLLYESFHDFDEDYESIYGRYDSDTNTYSKLCREMGKVYEDTFGKAGVYFLYDINKELIYIGKSTSNLAERLLTSARERKIAFYVMYATTPTKTDANLYELFYISKHKPVLNSACKEDDEFSQEIPDLQFSELYQLYEIGIK
jgi:hypothetical protein